MTCDMLEHSGPVSARGARNEGQVVGIREASLSLFHSTSFRYS